MLCEHAFGAEEVFEGPLETLGTRLASHLMLPISPVTDTNEIDDFERVSRGRNGVGKATLLRILFGGLSATSRAAVLAERVASCSRRFDRVAAKTIANSFGAVDALVVLKRAEAGIANVDELADAHWMLEERIISALRAPRDLPRLDQRHEGRSILKRTGGLPKPARIPRCFI